MYTLVHCYVIRVYLFLFYGVDQKWVELTKENNFVLECQAAKLLCHQIQAKLEYRHVIHGVNLGELC